MALYSPTEIHEILIKLSQEPQIEVKYSKFQRLGIEVLVNNKKSSESNEKEDGQQYTCSVCRKKLISVHLLDLHVSENHDSYFDVQKLKKPMVSKETSKFFGNFYMFPPYSTHVILRNASTYR